MKRMPPLTVLGDIEILQVVPRTPPRPQGQKHSSYGIYENSHSYRLAYTQVGGATSPTHSTDHMSGRLSMASLNTYHPITKSFLERTGDITVNSVRSYRVQVQASLGY